MKKMMKIFIIVILAIFIFLFLWILTAVTIGNMIELNRKQLLFFEKENFSIIRVK
jgi:hypothetical protein